MGGTFRMKMFEKLTWWRCRWTCRPSTGSRLQHQRKLRARSPAVPVPAHHPTFYTRLNQNSECSGWNEKSKSKVIVSLETDNEAAQKWVKMRILEASWRAKVVEMSSETRTRIIHWTPNSAFCIKCIWKMVWLQFNKNIPVGIGSGESILRYSSSIILVDTINREFFGS